MIRQHIVYDSRRSCAEERNASFSAKLLTSVVAGFSLAVGFLNLSSPLRLPQNAGLMSAVPVQEKPVTAEPIRYERNWVIMTVPVGAWKIAVEKPEPVLTPEAPEPQKSTTAKKEPVKKSVRSVQKKSSPNVATKVSAGSAQAATLLTGSGQQTSNMSSALSQIVEIIERHKEYPKRARDIGLEGTTRLLVSVNHEGSVVDFKLKEGGNALLRRATMNAARHLKGVKTAAREAAVLEIPVRYELD